MILSYIKFALRSIMKVKLFSFINIFGLSLGMAMSILILLWVSDELSFNTFHKNYDQLYQVFEKQYYSDRGVFSVTATPFPLGPAMKEEYPEVVYSSRIDNYSGQNTFIKYGDNQFKEDLVFVDPDFLKMFTFNSITGNLETALSNPNSIVITKEIADKYFGSENPVGKLLRGDNNYDFNVVAVIENVPSNSSLQFDILATMEFLKSLRPNYFENWGSNSVRTFVMLAPNTDLKAFGDKILNRVKEYQERVGTEVYLNPISRIHLYSLPGRDKAGRIQTVIVFAIVAAFILLIASINFINLSTARATKRSKEVGIKKVIGASRAQVAKQFFGESVLLALISLVLALAVVSLLLPEFNNITGKEIAIDYLSKEFLLLIIGVTVFVGLVSGTYPSLYLSRFVPVQILSKRGSGNLSGARLRTVLVIVQFSISVILILATIVLYMQTDFLLNKDLGINKENVFYIPTDQEIKDNIEVIKNEFKSLSSVEEVGLGLHIPTMIGWNGGGWDWEGKPEGADPLVTVTYADNNWWKVFDMKIIEGRGFSDEHDNLGSDKIIINETFAKMIGDGSVVGRTVRRGENSVFTIIGVVKDFDYLNLRGSIGPLSIFNDPDDSYLFVKIKKGHVKEALDQTNRIFEERLNGRQASFTFLDDYYRGTFKSEEREQKLAGYFAILTIIIACLGLFGLSSFVAEQRTKEIGIRKVLGASVSNIVKMISKEFVLLVLLGTCIASPIAYYLMNKWLENFAYKITIGPEIFVYSFVITLVITLATISIQAIKAATANPVEALRYE